MSNKLKEIDIKSCTYSFFNDSQYKNSWSKLNQNR